MIVSQRSSLGQRVSQPPTAAPQSQPRPKHILTHEKIPTKNAKPAPEQYDAIDEKVVSELPKLQPARLDRSTKI